MTYCLRYKPDSPLGKQYKSWRWGFRRTRESAEASRMQCFNVDQIEVVEVEE